MAAAFLSAILATKTARVTTFATFLLSLALCRVPLFGVHGVESAFVLGILLPLLAALHAERLERQVAMGDTRLFHAPLARATSVATLHLAIPLLVLALNSLRVRQCEPMVGLAYMLLGPYVGTLLATWLVAATSTLTKRVALRILLALLPPLSGLAWFAYGFYATPAIKAYGHFFGYFPGSFYDEVVLFPWPLLWLRLGTLSWLCAVMLALRLQTLDRNDQRTSWRLHAASLTTAIALALVIEAQGPELGIRVSETHIQEKLGATLRSARCDILLPREYAHKQRFADDCDFRVTQMERFFGLRQKAPVRVYLFRSAAEKRALIGAADTNIAKPWRHEIYVQLEGFPHPLLAHEIAHVVIGNSGVGPFRIAASMLGLWPNPGLIEGMAMAADFRPHADLTPHQWAKAAFDNQQAPALSTLFGANFFGHTQGLAYTLAGSFLHFVYETHGNAALRRLYRSGDFEEALGQSLQKAERTWKKYLQTVELPKDAAALARQRFDRHSVLSAVCPHRMAVMQHAASGAMEAGDFDEAIAQCNHALSFDEQQSSFVATRTIAQAKAGRLEAAQKGLARLQAIAAAPLVAKTKQAIADALAERRKFSEADRMYAQLETAPQTQGSLRQLQVKRLALSGSERQRTLLLDLLIDHPGVEHDPGFAVHIARELRGERSDGLPHYLEARQLYFHEHYDDAATLFTKALALGLPSDEMHGEALRLQALCLLVAGHVKEAKQHYQSLATQGSAASRWEAKDFLARIAFMTRNVVM